MSAESPPAGGRPPDRAAAGRRVALDWLIGACRAWLGEGRRASAAETPPSRDLARAAHRHNLEPLLHSLCARGRLEPPDGSLAGRWQEAYYRSLARNGAVLDALGPLLSGCASAGVEVVILKGVATAATAYGDPALRESSDVDLLCREPDLEPLCRVAAGLGYRSAGEDAVYHLTLHHRDLPLPLEVHFDVYDLLADRAGFLERARAGRRELEIDGHAVPALAPEAAVTFTLAHLLHHDLGLNLRAYLDLAALLRALPGDAALEEELAAADLAPEAALVGGVLDGLFGTGAGTRLGRAPSAAAVAELLAAVRARLLDVEATARGAALEEVAARPWRTRPGYLRRLLVPPPARLRALRHLPPLHPGPAPGYLHHLRAALRRGRAKLRSRGLARAGAAGGPSLKRQVLARRRGARP